MNSSGFSIIRWQSSGNSVALRSDFTTGGPMRQVRHEVTIHDVDMDDMPPRLARGAHLLAQSGEISRKNH